MTQELSSNRKSVQAASGVKAYGCVKLQLAEEYVYAELCEEVMLSFASENKRACPR